VEFDVIRLADIVVSSTPERDPVQFSKQWPELFIYILSYHNKWITITKQFVS
jgi:hypothetical protein